jgi:hypothetical protein
VCSARWKIVPEGEGDRPAVCPVCETRGATATHWRNAARDYGWRRGDVPLVVELWAPHGRDVPREWMERVFDREFLDAQPGPPSA